MDLPCEPKNSRQTQKHVFDDLPPTTNRLEGHVQVCNVRISRGFLIVRQVSHGTRGKGEPTLRSKSNGSARFVHAAQCGFGTQCLGICWWTLQVNQGVGEVVAIEAWDPTRWFMVTDIGALSIWPERQEKGEPLCTLGVGTSFEAIGQSSNWLQVCLLGQVSATSLKHAAPPPPPSANRSRLPAYIYAISGFLFMPLPPKQSVQNMRMINPSMYIGTSPQRLCV